MLFVFTVSAFAQISFWFAVWIGLRRASDVVPETTSEEVLPISVIVASRNADATLPGLLAALAQQRHPAFEVVVVDDGSNDTTADLMFDMHQRDQRFRRVANPEDSRGKKGAVSTGLRVARYDLIAFTDADCRPGPDWLNALSRAHTNDSVIVVGYGPYARTASFLNSMIRFETLATAMTTAAAIGLNHPYMAVGRNLSYRKDVASGMSTSPRGDNLLSGDDDLLVQEASANGVSVKYLFDRESFVVSDAPSTLRSWIRQKRRHISASRSYRKSSLVILAAFHGSSLLCWIAPLFFGWFGTLLLAAKLAVQWPVTASAISRFGEKDLITRLPLLDFSWLVSLVILTPVGILFPPSKW